MRTGTRLEYARYPVPEWIFIMAIVLPRRAPFFAMAAVCAGLLGFGYYLQFQSGLEPCPLCVFQRICFMAIALLALAAGAHGARHRGAAVYCALIFIVARPGDPRCRPQ